jgi:hypothetical protein
MLSMVSTVAYAKFARTRAREILQNRALTTVDSTLWLGLVNAEILWITLATIRFAAFAALTGKSDVFPLIPACE